MSTNDSSSDGFVIERPRDLAGWKVLRIGSELPLCVMDSCPADGSQLALVCTLADGVSTLRVGACPACGHVMFIDRPSREWLAGFYRDTWDSADRNAARVEIERRRQKLAAHHLGVERPAVALARALDVDRTRPICEIGCGYGTSLKQLQLSGFSNVIGIDASSHRAEVVRQAFGFDVITSPFEAPQTQDQLKARGPFSIIFSVHALEHTLDPAEVIAAASRLQCDGDHLILSVPNVVGEPSMGVLMFLPHLHSFSAASLAALGARHGYGVTDAHLTTGDELNVVLRKRPGAVAPPGRGGGDAAAVDKFRQALALDRAYAGERLLWWKKRSDGGGQLTLTGDAVADERHWHDLAATVEGDTLRSVVVTNLTHRLIDPAESPIEIQFRDQLFVFYK